jgi:DNA repair protein RecO (recombination protein O)
VQLFRSVALSWSGRGDLVTLTGIEPESEALQLPGDALASGFYVNELLIRLVHRYDPDETLYNCYVSTLRALAEGSHIEATLRQFEKTLLEVLGYGPITDHDVSSGAVLDPNAQYYYALHQGPSTVSAQNTEALAVSGRTLMDIRCNDFSNAKTRQESKLLMRFLLKSLLGDKPLASRELLVQH